MSACLRSWYSDEALMTCLDGLNAGDILQREGVLADVQVGAAQQAHSVIVVVAAVHHSIHHRLWPCITCTSQSLGTLPR